MVESKQKSFLFGTDISAGAAPKRRFAFYLWNYGLLSLSAAGICVITLQLAIGVYTSEIFSLLGWDGSAYMKLTNSYRDELPVVNSNGFYLDNGEVATELSDGLSDKKDQFDCIQYYIRKHFYYSEVAS